MTARTPPARLAAVLLVLGSGATPACATSHHPAYSGAEPPRRDLASIGQTLEALCARSPRLELGAVGEVRWPRFLAPLWVVRYRPPQPRARILLIGGAHGDEPAGVDALLSLVAGLAERPGPFSHVAADIVPMLNPWGHSRGVRHNLDGVDLNRDLASRRSQEARLLAAFLEGQRYDLAVDLHEDGAASGPYLYAYAPARLDGARAVLRRWRALGVAPERHLRFLALEVEGGVLRAPLWGLWYMRLSDQLSVGNYLRLEVSDRVYTVESPRGAALTRRLAIHRSALDALVAAALRAQVRAARDRGRSPRRAG